MKARDAKDQPAGIRRRSKTFRRLSGGLALMFALITMGFLYGALAPSPQTASADPASTAQIAAGKQIYETSCITCHGVNLQGVLDRGPSLIGVGQAAVYFQVSTGRMPADANGAQMPRKQPVFNDTQIDALGAFVQSNGGGPEVPGGNLQDVANVAKGGELYRLNCASCHNFTGEGGALSQGKYAPNLRDATDSADLRGHAVRPGEHAEVLGRPADVRREAGDCGIRPEQQGQRGARRVRPRRLRSGPRRPGGLPGRHGRDRGADAVDGSEGVSEHRSEARVRSGANQTMSACAKSQDSE